MAVKWHIAYHKLADLLAHFYQANTSAPARAFADLCLASPAILKNNSWVLRVTENKDDYGIDPIQVFANLSEPQAGSQLKEQRLNAFFSALGASNVSNVDFIGCPTLFTIKVTARRPSTVQNSIWRLLGDVVQSGREAITEETFTALRTWYGVNIASLTVFLFWLDAEQFLPMDQNTVRYLDHQGWLKGRPKTFAQYAAVLKNPAIIDYPNISIVAKENSLLNSKSEIAAPALIRKKRIKRIDEILATEKSQIDGCRLLAIRVYKETADRWRKVLPKNGKIYNFYRAFTFSEKISRFKPENDREIAYDPFRDTPLYQEGKLSVHISALVGENGSGKSTLTELILLAINNFTTNFTSIPQNLIPVKGLFLDLFFITDALYKMSIQGDTYLLQRYVRTEKSFQFKEDVTLLDFDMEQFYYSLVTNYALYALNEHQLGKWVRQLFHKNDQYQVPVNISPFRDFGNIDINKENNLVNTRLVANLLLPTDQAKRSNDTIRKLTPSKTAEMLMLKLQPKKFESLYEYPEKTFHKFDVAAGYWRPILNKIKSSFGIAQEVPPDVLSAPATYVEACWMYLLKKVISICMTYRDFNIYFDPDINEFDLKLLDELMTELHRQKSHVTHKFYQAVHFLTEDHLETLRETAVVAEQVPYEINALSEVIKTKVADRQDKQIKSIHFVPPAFLDIKIKLTGNVDFDDLSSGEKQKIYSVSSVIYHLLNIDSNADQDDLVRYSGVVIIFDEVELYFHPEMQRSFIKYLLDYLTRLELEVITSVNIIFVTHSPFILSDVPADNIIFLGDTEPDIKTFAANIHTLLAESFFLKESFMGEYAQEVINDLISYLINEKYVRNWDPEKAETIINAIGEPLLKNRLEDIFTKKFEAGRSREEKIKKLRYQLDLLENEKNN